MKIAYVAGPYRAVNKFGIMRNIIKAREVSKELWGMGYAVICPHSNTALFDGCAPDKNFLEGDIEFIKFCNVLILLPDWEKSSGTRNEKKFAEEHGIPVRYWGIDNDLIKREVV